MRNFLCELLFSCLLAVPGAKSIDELTYGTALYAYYQQDYEQALVNVLVAERQQRIGAAGGHTGADPVRFELAKGSFAFQEGMYRYAEATFAAVADAELTDLDRMRLAFHLAREHYRRGDWAAMDTELTRIDLGANWRGRQRRHPEVTFMRAEGALARGDFVAAAGALDTLPEDDAFRGYGLFNLGVAYRQAGAVEPARHAFARLAGMRPAGAETWDLVQRGRLAVAVLARQGGDAVDAETMLATLPAEGRYRDVALTSYGNLATARSEHELAARIWLTLLESDTWNVGSAAANLGLPMSLEALASPNQALDRYRAAERTFENRLAALQSAADRARDPVWVDRLLGIFAEPDDSVRRRALAQFDSSLGEQTWLKWLADEDVHRVMLEWRELTDMAGYLDRLPRRITAYEEVTRERRRRAAQAREHLDDDALAVRREVLGARVEEQASAIAALRHQPAQMNSQWMGRLAGDEERALLAQLDDMTASIGSYMPERDQPRFQKRVERLKGMLFWRLAEERASRLRDLEKQLAGNRALLAAVDQRIERLAAAEARFAAGVETDFIALSDRAGDVSRRVAMALGARREAIAQVLERGLHDEVAQTRQYLLTARIAIARATDQLAANTGGGGDDS